MFTGTQWVAVSLLLSISTDGVLCLDKIKNNIFATVYRQPDVSEDSSVASGKISSNENKWEGKLECIREADTQMLVFTNENAKHCMTKVGRFLFIFKATTGTGH